VVDAREHAEQPPAPQHTHLMRDAIEGTQRSSEQPPAPQQTHLMRGAIKGTQHTHLMRDAIKGTQSSSHAPRPSRPILCSGASRRHAAAVEHRPDDGGNQGGN